MATRDAALGRSRRSASRPEARSSVSLVAAGPAARAALVDRLSPFAALIVVSLALLLVGKADLRLLGRGRRTG